MMRKLYNFILDELNHRYRRGLRPVHEVVIAVWLLGLTVLVCLMVFVWHWKDRPWFGFRVGDTVLIKHCRCPACRTFLDPEKYYKVPPAGQIGTLTERRTPLLFWTVEIDGGSYALLDSFVLVDRKK